MLMVALFFMVSVVNNYALNFNIPMPLHMIFRAVSFVCAYLLRVLLATLRVSSDEQIVSSCFSFLMPGDNLPMNERLLTPC